MLDINTLDSGLWSSNELAGRNMHMLDLQDDMSQHMTLTLCAFE